MFANQADAQVIYTDVDPDFIITEPADPPYTDILVMDINMDSSPEGTFAFSVSCLMAVVIQQDP